MTITSISNDIGKEDNACSILSVLPEQSQCIIASLLADLSSELQGVIWPMPIASLHHTLVEILQPKPYELDKQVIFDAHKNEYLAAIDRVLSHYRPFILRFNVIEVSPQAIIVRADDATIFNQIRSELVQELQLPQSTKLPPRIVHSSIARFIKEVDVAMVEAIVKRHSIDYREVVSEFQVRDHTWPHMLQYEIVKRYPLSATSMQSK
jgi:hypothetical protein